MKTRECLVHGVRVRFTDTATPDAPVLVALHGYPDTLRVFGSLSEHLASFRVIAPDWPGQGGSDVLQEVCGPVARAAWLFAFLRSLGVNRCSLFGHDMGALPALFLAQMHPECVHRVFVANALLANEAKTSWSIRVMRRAKAYRLALPLAGPLVFSRCMATFLEGKLPADILDEMRSDFLRPLALRTLVKICDAYDDSLPRALGALTRIERPVHALWGRGETHFAVEHAHALASYVKHTTVDRVDGGHWMAFERAEEIAQHIVWRASQ